MFPTSDGSCTRARPMLPVLLIATLLLVDCGGSGYGSSNMGPPLTPTVNLAVDPLTITVGQSATLTWTTSNASSCVASGGWSGSQDTNSKQTVTPTASGTVSYTLTCTAPSGAGYMGGGGGQAAKTVTLMVNAASAFTLTNLVTRTGTGAQTPDDKLINAWGIAFGPMTPAWVANNHSDTSTIYDGSGKPLPPPPQGPLVVTMTDVAPTGVVFNSSQTDFMVTTGGVSAPALFIFSGESGKLAAWTPDSGATAVTVYPAAGGDSGGAIYKGLAIAKNGSDTFLYATDFHNNKVDMFDKAFARQTGPAAAFVDPNLPAGYAPFGIQAIAGGMGGAVQIYVSYAKQDDAAQDDVAGAGLGLINIFDTSGTFVKRLVTVGAALNAPWGMALAPADFGTLSNVLLVGNFGDGKINGYDPDKGTFMGAITDSSGKAVSVDGLWGIAFGNDAHNQPHNTLFFAAGPDDENDGAYGRIDLGGPPTLN
jgi:uncharacterized protein (TIGR03118 family)